MRCRTPQKGKPEASPPPDLCTLPTTEPSQGNMMTWRPSFWGRGVPLHGSVLFCWHHNRSQYARLKAGQIPRPNRMRGFRAGQEEGGMQGSPQRMDFGKKKKKNGLWRTHTLPKGILKSFCCGVCSIIPLPTSSPLYPFPSLLPLGKSTCLSY